ncbi:HD domain-containing protein [Sedimentibacter sp. zth1]|uniref:HD domain-containing protein n=1 Tax=Sedimentibacter sp. zth1 TaxID=2816908 RepID=UPI001A93722A|nr:HD domain-containing protein [Sedimentibacter sp. zth1]QSX05229.1 HD domain-containing protein [Sedimentibacter sp. zth1]
MKIYDNDFLCIAEPILTHPEYQQTKNIKHHDESVYDHSLKVAYYSYEIAKKKGLDWQSCIRGALLHDFFLYKFYKRKHIGIISDSIKHAINHPKIALENSKKYFDLNELEEDIIKGHMFPFGLPKGKEAWIVSFVDKYIAIFEYCSNFKKITSNKYSFNTK